MKKITVDPREREFEIFGSKILIVPSNILFDTENMSRQSPEGDNYSGVLERFAKNLVETDDPNELLAISVWRQGAAREVHPFFVYALSKQIDGMPTANGTFPLAAKRISTFLHQRTRQFFYEPLEDPEMIREVLFLNHSLRKGGVPEWALPAIQVSIEVFRSIYSADQGRAPLPTANDDKVGDHAVMLAGGWQESGAVLQFINSWGEEWGDRGMGWLSMEYLDRFLIEAWLTRVARIGPSRFTYEPFIHASTAERQASIWMVPNLRWRRRVKIRTHRFQLVIYETLSVAEQCPVEIIEVRTGYGLRVGWAHLYHHRTAPRIAVLKELFVWPSFRRQGCGVLLNEVATANARRWGANRLQLYLHEMDAQPDAWPAAREFAQRSGFRWTSEHRKRPLVLAIAEKEL